MLPRARVTTTRLWRDRRAATALEFAVVGPVFLMFLVAAFGVAIVGYLQLALDDAARNAGRQIQIYGSAATSKSNFISAVCQTFGVLMSDCTTSLTYNVQASTSSAGFAGLSPATPNAAGKFSNTFPSGTIPANVNVLVQVSYPLPFTLPFFGTLITGTGYNAVVSQTTLRVEPYG